MVYLNGGPLVTSFAAQLNDLKGAVAASYRPATPEGGFVEWVLNQSGTVLDLGLEQFDPDTLPSQRWNEAPVLATVGFRLGTSPTFKPMMQRWIDGMKRLRVRDVVPVDRNSFFFRPLELLGLTIGSRAVEQLDGSVRQWIREIMDAHSDRLPVSTLWSQTLVSLAAHKIGAAYSMDPVVPKTQVDIALALCLYLIDGAFARIITSIKPPTLHGQLLEMAATTQIELPTAAERAVLFIGLRDAVRTAVAEIHLSPSGAAQLVVSLFRRFPLFVSELRKRHNNREALTVADEYDVQDLIRSLLRLHFTDVRREEWNPSYGAVQSRVDFLLKPERVVIETKMTRSGLGQRELVEQLIVDKEQYRQSPNCRTLVCFVYDPELRLPNPPAIERDLSGDDGTLLTLVVVAPQGL